MRLTVQLKLLPTPQQAEALRRTLETANEGKSVGLDACNAISHVAWETQTFRQFPLHRRTYRSVRKTFGLTAQLTVRCIAKVAEAYQHHTNTQPIFKPHGSVAYDDRILSFALQDSLVSIWTLEGRQTIPFGCGDRQRMLLAYRQGETDLVFSNGSWTLYATCEVQTPRPFEAEDVLGVDLGVTNIATDSDGEVYSGKAVKNVRHRHRRLRQKLQRKGTLGARRQGRRPSPRAFIAYKAALKGVPVHYVDPRNTSRTCPNCGHCAKENRRTQSSFVCPSCAFAGLADVIAAGNIACRAAVNRPYCSDTDVASRAQRVRQSKAAVFRQQ